MFGSVFGMNSGLLGNAQQATPGGLANQYSSPHQQNIQNQQALYNQYAQGMFNQMATTKPFRLAGVDMTFDEFLQEVAPDDSPMRTFLTLKYKGRDDTTKKNI